MNALAIQTRNDQTHFQPGDEVAGSAGWNLDQPPRTVELRLFWYTRGKGDRDVKIVDQIHFDAPHQSDQRDFRFVLPDAPYSFSSRLVSLIWALELVVLPGKESRELEIVLSSTGREVDLLKQTGGDV